MKVTPLRTAYIAFGTGYGVEDDWRHGMYQGPLVVQYKEYLEEDPSRGAGTRSSTTSRASSRRHGDVGYGLHEHGFFGPFPKYGLERMDDGAS